MQILLCLKILPATASTKASSYFTLLFLIKKSPISEYIKGVNKICSYVKAIVNSKPKSKA